MSINKIETTQMYQSIATLNTIINRIDWKKELGKLEHSKMIAICSDQEFRMEVLRNEDKLNDIKELLGFYAEIKDHLDRIRASLS